METLLINEINQLNPWWKNKDYTQLGPSGLLKRVQLQPILEQEWDNVWTVLVGPRRAGKTTLGKMLARALLEQKRFDELLYLNCDFLNIRNWLKSPVFIQEAIDQFHLSKPILFIDEVQRLENPGLLLKAIIDLNYPIKHIATGSSQLELKSKVQEHLTGRQLSATILPLSISEQSPDVKLDQLLIYGSYPQVCLSSQPQLQLNEIYQNYILKDIVEILKVGNPDVFQKLITLLAHQSGQLSNINQLAADCRVSVSMIRNYINILEQTYVIESVSPFVGNKRTELTRVPIYYFIDNGFRNTALRNYTDINSRTDIGLLVENFIFQEILKLKKQNFMLFDIHYWRTKSGAEVDFVLYKNEQQFIPIEVKYRNMTKATVSKGFRSFIQAYKPSSAIFITKNFSAEQLIDGCEVKFIPLHEIHKTMNVVSMILK